MKRKKKRLPATIPYPPVFHDWQHDERRVATGSGIAGVRVELTLGETAPGGGGIWREVQLTEDDAVLLAASLLRRAERDDLADHVLANASPSKRGNT